MNFSFDIRGNLKPYEIIETSIETFENTFVLPYDEESSRKILFTKYKRYTSELRKLLTKDFFQWIDGSFVTTKQKPNDIDVITVINFEDYLHNLVPLEQGFTSIAARGKYGIDAYLIPQYPENHKNHAFSKSDLLYWRNLFSKTRVNRAKKQFEKGIIQLNFHQNG